MKYSIIIATRNRFMLLRELLHSLEKVKPIPLEIIIVSSGIESYEFLDHYRSLKIRHCHILDYGQIRQKLIGIDLLDEKSEWILFLDDDISLDVHAISKIHNYLYEHDQSKKIWGVGLCDKTMKIEVPNNRSGGALGKVTLDGRNLDYMCSKVPIEVEWLNGISLWRKEGLKYYNFDFLKSRYSLCEDLIFSYRVRKYENAKLVFLPDAIYQANYQSRVTFEDVSVFASYCYWKMRFIQENHEFSKVLFVIRLFFHSIYIDLSRVFLLNKFSEFKNLKVWFLLFLAISKQESAIKTLEQKIS